MRVVFKDLLGRLPGTARLYDFARPERPRTRFNLEQLASHLDSAVGDVRQSVASRDAGPRLLLFATLHYWIEQAVMVGLALRGMGNAVSLAYLPYSSWEREINEFDLRRQDLYTRKVLAPLTGLMGTTSLLDVKRASRIPAGLQAGVEQACDYDVMYSLQIEEVDRRSDLYQLRRRRNREACLRALTLLQNEHPDAVLIPNGLVTELGVVYQVARHLDIPTITYEFNDQREQIWLAQNDVVMRQNTDALWRARSTRRLTAGERAKMAALEAARSGGTTYAKGTRAWQDGPAEGSARQRKLLGLDGRPVALLATNVLGDSLTLGRNLFAQSMEEWIFRTVQYFVSRPEVQLLIRVHPGERLIKGPSMVKVIQRAAPHDPESIHVIAATDKTNTYDLMGLAGFGLAYTTTVGLEMAMRGIPVIVAGRTHFRGRGFTLDPASWDEYYVMLDRVLAAPARHRLSARQTTAAWNYAYRFFFEYPFDFPWRLMHLWNDVDEWPLRRVLAEEGQTAFGRAFRALAGKPVGW
jgi:hypothetical protein